MEESAAVCPKCGATNRLKQSTDQLPACGKCKSLLPWITKATDATFAFEIAATVPVIVDFWAVWCGPCRFLTPIVESMASEMAGKLKVVKVNVDENPQVSRQFQVMSIPTLIVFKGRKPVDTIVGALPKTALLQRIAPHLTEG